MRWNVRIQFSMATIMMIVLTAATATALFVKVRQRSGLVIAPGWKIDIPSLLLLAIGLTTIALASWKEHTLIQALLQATLACLGCLALIWIGEGRYDRGIRYWFEGSFAVTVSLPLLARRFIKTRMPRGPRRDWWKKTCEAMFFSFLNLMLIIGGAMLQALVYFLGKSVLEIPVAA